MNPVRLTLLLLTGVIILRLRNPAAFRELAALARGLKHARKPSRHR